MDRADLHLVQSIKNCARPLTGARDDYDELVAAVGDARLVLIGEASHGTHEFYRERAQLTKRLIAEKQFSAVVVEADWPDAFRVHRFVQHRSSDPDAVDALGDFRRFPQWMWRNADMLDFVGWLRAHNGHAGAAPVGFYGLDLYSLHSSMQAVLRILEHLDPAAARRARERYACFDHLAERPQAYGYATRIDVGRSCEDEVVAQLIELQHRRQMLAQAADAGTRDQLFIAEQNAFVVQNAERFYRHLFDGTVDTWNLRDEHMGDTVDALLDHLGERAKLIVWAHNSHVGDARATEMSRRGELNLGQICRERHRHPGEVLIIGFSSFCGSVSAASQWDGPVERKRLRPALADSYEELLHAVGIDRFLVDLRELAEGAAGLVEPRLERAVGVLYLPDAERQSHYFMVSLPSQFDFAIHIDETRAVEPLERSSGWEAGELPETYPQGL